MSEIQKGNISEQIDGKKETAITDMTNKAIKEVFNEIIGTPLEDIDTFFIPVGDEILPIFDEYRDTETEEEYRKLRGDIKYNQEKSTLESRGNETKIEKINENGIIRIEGLDFDIPIKEGIRLLNFKNWIKFMKTEREKDNPKIIYSGMNKTKKRRMINNTFYKHDRKYKKLVRSHTIEKYCPKITKDETKMEKIAERLNK